MGTKSEAVESTIMLSYLSMAPMGGRLTWAGRGGDADAHQVLEGEHAGQEAAVLGPDLRDGLPPSLVHDGNQAESVQHGVEVHTLANYIHCQQEACLETWRMGRERGT